MATTERLILGAFALVLLVGMGWLIAHMLRTRQRLEKAWGAFAQQHGLHLRRGKGEWPTLTGNHRGVRVAVELEARGTGDNRSLHTFVRASCRRALPNDLALRPQGWFFALARAYGAQDIEIGDAAFDGAFVIECADEAGAHALLADPALRHALIDHADHEPGLSVQGGRVLAERNGEVTQPAKLLAMLDAVAGAALALEAATTGPAMKQHARTAHSSQHWFLERDPIQVFKAVMMFPLGFVIWLLASGLLLPRPYAPLGIVIGVLSVAVTFKLLWPPRPRISVNGDVLVLQNGKQTLSLPLRQCRIWYGAWRKSGYFCGTILYLQLGDQTLAIAGTKYSLDDPSHYQVEPAPAGDVMMLHKPFAKLLNHLGYVMRADRHK